MYLRDYSYIVTLFNQYYPLKIYILCNCCVILIDIYSIVV